MRIYFVSLYDCTSLVCFGTRTISGVEEREVTEKDSFLFGSGTKPYTALAVMQLVEQGVVKLDDPVSKHIDPVLTALTKNASFTFG